MFLTLEPIFILTIILCGGIGSIVGYRNRKKFNHLGFFYIYPGLSSLLSIASLIQFFNHPFHSVVREVISCGITIFMVVEFLFLYNFFLAVLESRKMKILLYVIAILYLLLILYLCFFSYGPHAYPRYLFLSQSIVILIPTGYYFVQKFRQDLSLELQKDPDFWISMGSLIYFGGTIPLFLLIDVSLNKDGGLVSNVYFINHIAYSVFYLLIAKAYLCPLKNKPDIK